MIDEVKKSAYSLLDDRMTSPFWGAFICSWLIWNWKILYLTFIVDQDKIAGTKIDYILNHFSGFHHIVTYPIVSTIILVTIVPVITNGAYWLSLKFQNWRSDQQKSIQKKQLLTLEQSIYLREEIVNQEKRFDTLLESKNLEIKQLKEIINEAKKITDTRLDVSVTNTDDDVEELLQKIEQNNSLKSAFDLIIKYIQSSWRISGDEVDSTTLSFFIANDIIEKHSNTVYRFTEKGKKLLKSYTAKNF